jgi:hypothetical protein
VSTHADRSARRREALTALALALALVALNDAAVIARLGLLHAAEDVLEHDHHRYIAMAESAPGRFEAEAPVPPFCWRLLAPALVWGLGRAGVGVDAGFYATTQLFLLGFLLALYAHLRQRGHAPEGARLGLVLAGLLPATLRWYAYQYWMPDPLALFLVALSFVLLWAGRGAWLVPLALVGVATRESYVIVLPYVLLFTLRTAGVGAALRRTLAVALPALGLLVAIRQLVEPAAAYDVAATLQRMVAFRLRHSRGGQQPYFMTLGTFGVLVPVLLLFPARAWGWCRRHYDDLAVIAVAYASLLLANNTDRLLVYALPALLPAALASLASWRELARVPLPPAALVLVAAQAFVWQQTRWLALGASLRQPLNLRVLALAATLWLAARVALARRVSPRAPVG